VKQAAAGLSQLKIPKPDPMQRYIFAPIAVPISG
jgi:hypothetical protein